MNAFADLLMGISVGVVVVVAVVAIRSRWRRAPERALQPSGERMPRSSTALGERGHASPERIEWFLGDEPLAQVSRSVPQPGHRLEEVSLDARLAAGLQPLLHAVPSLAVASQQVLSQAYTLTFSPKIAQGLRDGALTMMPSKMGGLRGNVIDDRGVIRSQASLSNVSRAASASLLVWQVLAVVTAQKYLSDINAKLASIEQGITRLQQWLEQERRGQLVGALAYLKQLVASIHASDFGEADLLAFTMQLESIERECQGVSAAVEEALDTCSLQASEMGMVGLRVKRFARGADEAAETFESRSKEFLLACSVRAAAIQVRAALPLSSGVTSRRLEGLKADMARHVMQRQEFLSLLGRRVPELKGKLSWKSTNKTARGALSQKLHAVRGTLDATQKPVASAVAALESKLGLEHGSQTAGIELVATLNGAGELVRLQRVILDDDAAR